MDFEKGRRLAELYKKEGLSEAATSAGNYISDTVTQKAYSPYYSACEKMYREKVIDHGELQNYSTSYTLDEEEEFSIKGDTAQLPAYFQRFVGSYNPQPRWVFDIENIILAGAYGMVFSEEFDPISTVTGDASKLVSYQQNKILGDEISLLRLLFAPPKPVDESVETDLLFPMTGLWCNNYFHWTAEYLPKLRALEDFIARTDERPKILLPANASEWMLDSLRLLGFDSSDYEFWDGGIARAQRVILTSHRVQTGGHYGIYDLSKTDYRWVRDRMVSNCPRPEEGKFSSRVYISRQKASNRGISNFEEVKEVLHTHGFEPYRLEELSVQDQVQLFSQAECVVSPHGSGLVNVLYAPEGTTVLELLPFAENKSHYFRLSAVLGHDYSYLLCDETYDGNIEIEPSTLAQKLQSLEEE